MNDICGYKIYDLLFKNSFTNIYKVKKNNKSFILKLINDNISKLSRKYQIQKEYDIAFKMSLKSSYFIKPIEIIDNFDYIGIVLEDYNLINLFSFYKEYTLSIDLFLNISSQIIQALHTLHSNGIIHRDLSPYNILINKDSYAIYLSDFSSSTYWREFENNYMSAKLGYPSVGSYKYLSPEHTGKINKPIDYRSDLYSLGLIFYEILSGYNPFDNIQSKLVLLYTYITIDLPPLHILSLTKTQYNNIPIILSNIINKLLIKSLDKRYQSCLGLLHDIQESKKYLNITLDSSYQLYTIPLLPDFISDLKQTYDSITELQCIQNYQKLISQRKNKIPSITPFILGLKDKTSLLLSPCNLHGREKELVLIQNKYIQSLQSKQKNTGIIILGYSGSGKTSLINRALKLLSQDISKDKKQIILHTKYPQFETSPFKCLISIFNDILLKISILDSSIYHKMENKFGLQKLSILGEQLIPLLKEKYTLIIPEQLPLVESLLRLQDITCQWIEFICFLYPNLSFIIYFDDFQWVDQNSISMIKSILLLQNIPFFFFFVVRDNEVIHNIDINNLFTNFINNNSAIKINVTSLDNNSIFNILKEMTNSNDSNLSDLCSIISKKTNGNPFFVIQFISSLYLNELLYFNFTSQQWEYKIYDINKLNYSSNVIDLLLNEIKTLSSNTYYIIQVASCIGYSFSYNLLSQIVNINDTDMVKYMKEALIKGFIHPYYNNNNNNNNIDTLLLNTDSIYSIKNDNIIDIFSFLHDKVHEGFYTTLNNDDKVEYHYKIGCILKKTYIESSPSEEIFNIVHHLTIAKDKFIHKNDILENIDLYLSAAILAKDLGCFSQSFEYGLLGKQLLLKLYSINDCWEYEYERIHNISYIICTTASVIIGLKRNILDLHFNFVYEYLKDPKDKIAFYILHARYFITSELYGELFNFCLHVLKEFGYSINPKLSIQDLINELTKTESQFINNSSITDHILNLQYSNQSSIESELSIFIAETAISIFLVGNLPVFSMMYLIGVQIIISENKLMETSAAILVGLAYALQCTFGPSKKSNLYGSTAFRITNNIKTSERLMSKIYFYGGLLAPFNNDFETDLFIKAIEYSCNSYDYGTLGYSLQQSCIYQVFCGIELSCLKSFAKDNLELAKLKFNRIYDMMVIISLYEAVYLLMYNKLPLDINSKLFKNAPDMFKAQAYFLKMQVYYILDSPKALELLSIIQLPTGIIAHYEYNFFSCLVRIKFNNNDTTLLTYIKNMIDNFVLYSNLHPKFLLRLYILKAEESRLENPDSLKAFQYYKKAISIAQEEKSYNMTAIASERILSFLEDNNFDLGLKDYIYQTIKYYKQWGATAKCKILQDKYNIEYKQSSDDILIENTDNIHDVILDNITTLLSTEYKTESSIKLFCEMILQQTGADKGSICYKYYDNIYILAEWYKDNDIYIYSHPHSDNISNIILAQDHKNIIPYPSIISNINKGIHTVCKLSIGLYIPMLSQNKVIGAVFLDNSLLQGVFPMNQTLLKHLICQIVSIIERNELNDSLKESLKQEQKRVKELEELNSFKDDFVAATSHELRTPLNSIIGYTELLLESNLTTAQKEQCDMIYVAGDGLLSIINDILDFQICKNNAITITYTDFDLRASIDHIFKIIDFKISQDIELSLNIDHRLPSELWIYGDRHRIEQILLNFLTNAVKFTPKGFVTVYIGKETNQTNISNYKKVYESKEIDDILLISIHDSGIGIPKEKQKLLFQPFSQLDHGSTRKYSGTGLGLVIAKNILSILSRNQSDIKFKSTINCGTEFYFNFPVKYSNCKEAKILSKNRYQYINELSNTFHILYTESETTKNCYLYEIHDIENTKHYFPSQLENIIDIIKQIRNKYVSQNIYCIIDIPYNIKYSIIYKIINDINIYNPCIILLSRVNIQKQIKEYFDTKQIDILIQYISKPFYKDVIINALYSFIKNKPLIQIIPTNDIQHTLSNIETSILMVEDNTMNQKIQSRIIKVILGQVCDIAKNGKEGVEFYKKRIKDGIPYKLIIMDFHMPVMDGKEASICIRNYEKENNIKHIHIIGLTADSVLYCTEMCTVIQKPIKKDIFKTTLLKYLEGECEYNK